MKHSNGRLGILVHTNRYFVFVAELAKAALQKQKQVDIHLQGDGVGFLASDEAWLLAAQARLYITEQGLGSLKEKIKGRLPQTLTVLPEGRLAALMEKWDRYVVF